ncbi:MAG: hypothetical protein Q9167_004665 [Letrouitia subvulpina]
MSETDPWKAARAKFTSDLNAEEKALFETATIDNLLESTLAAEKEHQQKSYSRKASKKLEPLVDAISQYGKALDIFSNTYSIAMAPLWGSIRDVNKEFEEMVDVFRNHVKSVEKEANLLSMVETHEGWSVAARKRKFKRRQQILSLLSEIRYTSKHQNERKKRHPGSGRWFTETREYEDWERGAQSQCLWCYGFPGSGKTVLMYQTADYFKDECVLTQIRSSVIDTLAERVLKRDISEAVALFGEVSNEEIAGARPAVIYHYCEFSDLRSMEPTIILGTLIRQLLETITIPEAFELSIDKISLDIDTYVESTVRSKISCGELEVSGITLEKEIIETLKEGAHGISVRFLWVHFQLLDLCDAASDRELRITLQNLPNGIIETYTRILEKISASRAKTMLVQQVFKWIVCAKRPMSLAELVEAVAFSYTDSCWSEEKIPKPSRLYEACRNLIVLNEEDDTVRLAHHTFRQLLLEQPQHLAIENFHIPLPEADIEVGEICVAYLSFSDFESQVTISNRQALPMSRMLEPMTIMEQVMFPSRLNNVATLILQVRNYLRPHSSLPQSLDFDLSRFAKLRISPSHELQHKYALLHYVIQYWISHTSAFHRRQTRMWKPFRRLALNKILPFDIRPWGDIDEGRHDGYEYLIQWAVNAEHLSLLQLLPNGCSIADALVIQAIRKDSLPIVEILMRKGVNPNARSEDGTTILQWATLRGHTTFLEVLVSLGADIDAVGPHGRTALILAARDGLTPSVEQLLILNAKIEPKDQFSNTALHLAVIRGYGSIVEVLLVKGADVEAKDQDRYTALHWAARRGHESIIDFLLAKGADIEAKQNDGSTALHLAVIQGYGSIVEFLLAKGADIEAKDQFGNTALHWVAYKDHKSMVEFLVAKGADIEAKNQDRNTALHRAASTGHERIVEFLVAKGADIEAKNRSRSTSIHLAARRGYESIVEFLLAKGADIEAKDQFGNTALHEAARRDSLRVVMKLVINRANVETRNKDKKTALDIAVLESYIRIVDVLKAAPKFQQKMDHLWECGSPSKEELARLLLDEAFEESWRRQKKEGPVSLESRTS